MKVREGLLKLQNIALCLVKKWWRPMSYIILGAGTFVNTVVIPLHKMEGVNLLELAALVTSWAPIIAIREWGKAKGVDVES